jgi:tetratricopeptide (TPR) repeat protein
VRRARAWAGLLAILLFLAARQAGATWLRPDPSYQEAEFALRLAARDTAGHADDAARLDSLGVALLRLGRQPDAERIFRRVLALSPRDPTAAAGLGKLALFHDRLVEAESLLVLAEREDREALADLMSVRLRSCDYAAAAAMAPAAGEDGRVALLQSMATDGAWVVSGSGTELLWKRTFPVPLVRVKLNGHSVLMALDTGAGDLLVDQSCAKRCGITPLAGQSLVFWNGARIAVKNAVVRRLELGDLRVEQLPCGILPLRKWSNLVNPLEEQVAGVIGLNLLERFTPTLDYARGRLELRPKEAGPGAVAGAARVPFEIWGESELMVYGSLAGGRRMALILATGLPGAGIGAPAEVMEEIGVKPGGVARVMKGAGAFAGGRPWYEVGVPSVVVGPLARDRMPGWSGALDSAELWRHGVRRDALLGGEFFRDRRLTIDWQRHELVVEEAK